MDDAALTKIRNRIDSELATKDEHIGIAFGMDLYKAFGERGWLTKERFTVSGSGAFPIEVIAYRKSHHAVALWEFDDWAYKVGSRDASRS